MYGSSESCVYYGSESACIGGRPGTSWLFRSEPFQKLGNGGKLA